MKLKSDKVELQTHDQDDGDAMGATWFVNYTAGPVSIGYQEAGTLIEV